MKPAPFAYVRPTTLDEALEACAQNPDAKILAGGQSLLPMLNMRLASPPMLIDINEIDELRYVRTDAAGVRIGALARHAAVEADVDARRVQPLLSQALRLVAHATIRNRGTTVGSIVHADAAGEMPMVLVLLGGTVTAAAVGGTREIAASDLFVGPLETTLAGGEIATQASFPAIGARDGVAIEEISRRHGDYALCGVGAVVTVSDAGTVEAVRAGYLSVTETPLVVDLGEAFADGGCGPENLGAAAEIARRAVDPYADIHASADYRRHLAGVLTRRVVERAYAGAAGRTQAAAA